MDANFVCLCCEGSYQKDKHECSSFCTPLEHGVAHKDFCGRCRRNIMRSFHRQMHYVKLKVEDRIDPTEDTA